MPHLEIGIFFVLAYIPYAVAELAGLSGIMAILFAVRQAEPRDTDVTRN